jgi:hypothetical protein
MTKIPNPKQKNKRFGIWCLGFVILELLSQGGAELL